MTRAYRVVCIPEREGAALKSKIRWSAFPNGKVAA